MRRPTRLGDIRLDTHCHLDRNPQSVDDVVQRHRRRRIRAVGHLLRQERHVNDTALPHLLVSYRAAFESATDTALATQGLRRNVCYTTPRFSSVPGVLGASPMISTVPDVLARRWEASGRLRSCPVPVALPGFTISMAWHARRDNDPALQWLMGLIKDIAAEP